MLQVQAASDRYVAELGRHNYVTLTSYLQLLSSFKSMLEAKRTANTNARKRYTVGLEKLASSASQVAGMQAELVAMQPQLVTTVAEVEELMTRIAQEKKVRRYTTGTFDSVLWWFALGVLPCCFDSTPTPSVQCMWLVKRFRAQIDSGLRDSHGMRTHASCCHVYHDGCVRLLRSLLVECC
jgi:hypothetical protein